VLRVLAVLAALVALVGAPAARAAAPTPEAAAYIVVNPATGEVLAERAPDRELPMASTTKIMTALVALERARLDDVMTVPPEAVAIGGSTGRLQAGERLPVRDLLTALLVPSGNDAAITLAAGVAGTQAAFVELMNARARELGLTATRFANPHGLDAPGHHSSARDLARLARAAMRYPYFREVVALRTASIPGPDGRGTRAYESRNGLLALDPEADGVKSGMTDGAGYTLVARSRRAELGVRLYAALLGSPSEEARARDADALLRWAFAQYARPVLIPPGAVYGAAEVVQRPGVRVDYAAAGPLRATIRLGRPVTEKIVARSQVRAPVRMGQALGEVIVRQDGRVLGRRELRATSTVAEASIWDRVRSGFASLLP
jgi:D-alanyl-D-alanine carboxypeptidase (penicillin-binding protein 5/6)